MRKRLLMVAFAALTVASSYAYEIGEYVYTATQRVKITGENIVQNGTFTNANEGWFNADAEAVDATVWDFALGEGAGPNGENAVTSVANTAGSALCSSWAIPADGLYLVTYDIKGATVAATGLVPTGTNCIDIFLTESEGGNLTKGEGDVSVSTVDGFKEEWKSNAYTFEATTSQSLVMHVERLAANTMITNIQIYPVTVVYDDRIIKSKIDYVDKLLATQKFTLDTDNGFVSNIVEAMRAMLGTDALDDPSEVENMMGEYENEYVKWLDLNGADLLKDEKKWSSYGDTRMANSWGTWTGGGGRWFHINNGGSNEITNNGDEIGHRFQGGVKGNAYMAYPLTPKTAGTYLFSLDVVGHYMAGTGGKSNNFLSNVTDNYVTDWNRDFKGVTVYAGKDQMMDNADNNATMNVEQEGQKVDCGVISNPNAKVNPQKFVVFYDVTQEMVDAGEKVWFGMTYIMDPEATIIGTNVNIANPQIRLLGVSQEQLDYEAEIASIKTQQGVLVERLAEAADKAAKTKADGFPWGHEALDSVRNAAQAVLTDSYTFIDKEGNILREADIRDSLKTEGATKVSVYVLNEVNSVKRAWQSYESLNASYTSLIEKAAEGQAFLNANVGRGDAERRQALENLVTQANGMIEATGAEEEKEAFDKQISDITEAIAVYKNTTTTYADPSEQQIAANPESSSDKNWTFTETVSGKENFKKATQGAGWEAGYYTAVWRGYTVSPQSKMVQTKEITDAGVYAFKAHATATNENYAFHVLMADIIDADPETGAVADTIFNHSEVKLFFGETGAADSVRVASRLRLNTGDKKSGAGSALASFGYDADPYVIYLIKADDKPMTVEFGMSSYGQVDGAGCNTYGFGDTQLLYYGKEDAFRQAMVADMINRIAVCEDKLKAFENDSTMATWTSRLSRRLVDAKSALAQTTSAKDLTTLANATFFVEQIAAKLKVAGIKGDVNGDGKIDVEDVVGIVNKILGEPAENFLEAYADVTGDGKIDVDDVVAVVNIILEGSDAAAAPQLMNILLQNGFKF